MEDKVTAVLRQFLSGEIEAPALQATLAELLQGDPNAQQLLVSRLQELWGKGTLPLQIYNTLLQLVSPEFQPDRQSPPDGPTLLRPSDQLPPPDTPTQHKTAVAPPSHRESETSSETGFIEQLLQPGALIHDRFVLEERIGVGGMGEVFRARDRRYEEYEDRDPYVAIKFLGREFRRHPESKKALQREVRKSHHLAHPNIVTVFNFDEDGPLIYMTMEYLQGSPLNEVINVHGVAGLPFDEAWPIIEGAGAALAYAHERGIVHSDFKPGNVFLTKNRRVKVLDFGIARAAATPTGDNKLTRFDVSELGALSPAYASPEMVAGLEPDPRDDIYALACVAYELLSGRHPFDRASAAVAQQENKEVQPIKGLPAKKMRALKNGLAFTRAERTATVDQFLQELSGVRPNAQALRAAVTAIAVLAIVGTAVGGYSWSQKCPNIDREFVASLQEKARSDAANMSASQMQRYVNLKDDLLRTGNDYLDLAATEFNPGDLSLGPSNAFGSFTRALVVDPNDQTAIDGIFRIVTLYQSQAEHLLDQGDSAASSEIAGYGLALHPGHCGLNSIAKKAGRDAD